MEDRKKGDEERVSLNTPLGMTIRKMLQTDDTTSITKFNLMEKTAWKITRRKTW
jgi:hypothetical protein